jgi:hypothetical protein
MTTFNIFDAYSKIRDLSGEADQAIVEGFDDVTRQKLFDVIRASKARDAGEDRVTAARKSARQLEHAYNNSVMAFEQVNPVKTTQADNMRAASAAQRPGYTPKDDGVRVKALAKTVAKCEADHAKLANQDKPNAVALGKVEADLARARKALAVSQLPAKTKAAMQAADEALASARAELLHAGADQKKLEAAYGASVNIWRGCLTTPTAEQVQREYMKCSQEERARQVAAGEVVVAEKSELDKILGARGKTKTNRQPVFYR